MAKSKRNKDDTQSFYDRIADVHNVALKINGYRASVAKYLRSLDLGMTANSNVLDAGSGTGIVSLGFIDSGLPADKFVAFDLSHKSLKIAAKEFQKLRADNFSTVQGNILAMPFPDDAFDLVITCGVLEYVSLNDGLAEMARVIKTGGKLVFIPVKPSLVGTMLEILYKFKIHPVENVRKISQQYFNIVGSHKFPIKEPISWSKSIFLLEKK